MASRGPGPVNEADSQPGVSTANGATSEGGRAGQGLALPAGAQGGPGKGPLAPQSLSWGLRTNAPKGALVEGGGLVGRGMSPRPGCEDTSGSAGRAHVRARWVLFVENEGSRKASWSVEYL